MTLRLYVLLVKAKSILHNPSINVIVSRLYHLAGLGKFLPFNKL